MANVLLTQKCVRSCPYCFAKKHMSDSVPDDILTWENLIYIADLLEISGEKSISLLGGEPFLHPNVIDFILYLLERKFHVAVFTSGILASDVLLKAEEYLLRRPLSDLSFICNVNDPKKSSFSETENVKRFLSSFGHIITLSYNIYRTDFNMDFLYQYINKYGLKRHLRLGLAHPIPGTNNSCIKPKDFKLLATNLIENLSLSNDLNIEAGFDCGFPLCIFSDEDIGKLYKINKGQLSFCCGPAVDIGPDMSVWSCFPLSQYNKKSLFEFDSFKDIHEYFINIHKIIKNETKGVFPECDTCSHYYNNLCSGGCLAHGLSKIIDEPRIRPMEVYPNE